MLFSRKSQIQGQVLIYLLAVILFGMILLYGYTAVKNLMAQGEMVAALQMKANLKADVEGTTFGDRKRINVDVPGIYKEVCFITNSLRNDGSLTGSSLCNKNNPDYHPIICDSVFIHLKDNMFLVDQLTEDMGYIGNFEVAGNNPPYLCIPVQNGRIVLKLEGGQGGVVYLSKWG